MNTHIEYFGYGANKDPLMMKAIIGRIPEGYPAELEGFELGIQSSDEIPEEVRKNLIPPWDTHFRSYFVRPTLRPFKAVKGIVWLITKEERKIIDNWEMTGKWYRIYLLKFKKGNEQTQIEIQAIDDHSIGQVVDGRNYRPYLNDNAKMIKVAQYVRYKYLKGYYD